MMNEVSLFGVFFLSVACCNPSLLEFVSGIPNHSFFANVDRLVCRVCRVARFSESNFAVKPKKGQILRSIAVVNCRGQKCRSDNRTDEAVKELTQNVIILALKT